MPANLTPQYRKAEEKYRQAHTLQEQIFCLEAMLQSIPKHKGTDRLQGDLRARLKETRAEILSEQAAGKSGKSYRIPRNGAGTVLVIGPPNAGKSSVLKALTSATPEVAPYPFTTREPQAGMMKWEDVAFQLIDTPPIARDHLEPYLSSFIRSADLILFCIDGSDDDSLVAVPDAIQEIERRKTRLGTENRFDENDFSLLHVRALGVVTRGDHADARIRMEWIEQERPIAFPVLYADLHYPAEINRLRNEIARNIPVLRIYTRRPGETERDPAPIALSPGGTVEDLAAKIHLDLAASLKFAKVWCAGIPAERTVQRDHILQDLDLVELYV